MMALFLPLYCRQGTSYWVSEHEIERADIARITIPSKNSCQLLHFLLLNTNIWKTICSVKKENKENRGEQSALFKMVHVQQVEQDDFAGESEMRSLVNQNNALFSNFRSSVRQRRDIIQLIML